jgi:diacylglycerol kinase (ATP)
MLNNRLNSFRYAYQGIADLFKNTPNAKIHLAFGIAVVACGFIFEISIAEWCLAIFAIGSVLAAEAFNTALEYLTDLVSPGYHQLAGKAKDAAAAGVLFTSMAAACVGLIIFVPKGWALLVSWWG